ncbi:MAG: hypothetical protein AAF596_01445 [Planctomycetota bacterium]
MRLLRGRKKNDQAGGLRELVAGDAERPAPPMLLVLGAKGGVGATTIAWRLTQTVQSGDRSPLAVDSHLWQPDLARVAGVSLAGGESLVDVLGGHAEPADAIRVGDGPPILPGTWEPPTGHAPREHGESFRNQVVQPLAGRFDLLVVDGGPSRSPWAESLCGVADLVLLVATPDELATLGAYSLIKSLAGAGAAHDDAVKVRLVINHSRGETHGRATHARLRDACREHLDVSVPLAGWLPTDPRMANRSEPPVPLMRPIARRVREALANRQAVNMPEETAAAA